MFSIQSFSSLIESNNVNLSNTSNDLLHGLKLYHDNQWYICGNLALNEGQFPHKLVNSSPDDIDFQLLAKAAMLLVQDSVEQPLTITTGFPYATFQIFKERAIEFFKKTHMIEFDGSTFGNSGKRTIMLDVNTVDVIPEIVACTMAIRKIEPQETGSFFVLSCGFGTFESVLSMDSGIVEQTMVSTPGIRYAVNILLNELRKSHYVEFRNAQLVDDAFQKGYIFLNRKNIDLRELRKNAIRTYYNEVISPSLRSIITDANLMKTNRVFLCGGAMYYQDLLDCFNEEFGEIAQLKVVANPENLASKGYAINSLRLSNGSKSSIGIDIGNATTVVANFAE
jgi:hypothetical protein